MRCSFPAPQPGPLGERQHERLVRDGAGEVAQHDRRVERPTPVPGEIGGAPIAAAAAAGGDEHDRATGLALGEHPRELQQRGRARQLGREPPRGSVAVGEDRDRAQPGRAGALRR